MTIKHVQNYIQKMLAEVSGMKVLLLDQQTTQIISLAFTQSQLLAKEVYLIDRIDNANRDRLKHLKCICFLRPTPETLQSLIEELRNPKYGEYHMYFSNVLKKSAIERLAEVDEFEVIKEVQEFFADYLAIDNDVYSLGLSLPEYSLYSDSANSWNALTLSRCTEGLMALLLSMKRKPLLRYSRNSELSKKLASELHFGMQQEAALFDFRKSDTPPILLILDRKNDPVTPLLNQWTYQAMVHELVGIENSRVNLSQVPGIKSEFSEVVLSAEQDRFYKESMFLNLGDLGVNIKNYVDQYQSKHQSTMKIESINDMKKFVEEYPEFRKLSGNVTKHVTLMGELSRQVDKGSLLEVSELEQSLACSENHQMDLKALQEILVKPNISQDSKVRLVMLYSLRYEKMPNNARTALIELAKSQGVSEAKLDLIPQLIKYAGSEQRQEDLFLNENVFSRTKNVFKGLKGAENVYTQHVPHFCTVIEALAKGKLKEQLYPFLEDPIKEKPLEIIVFVIGGLTYAETREIEKFRQLNPSVKITVGGTLVHNSSSFLRQVQDSYARWYGKTNATVQDDSFRMRSVKVDFT